MRRIWPLVLLLAAPLAAETGWDQFNLAVSQLPASCNPGRIYGINDGDNVDDCATGSGSTAVACQCNASGNGYNAIALMDSSGNLSIPGTLGSGASTTPGVDFKDSDMGGTPDVNAKIDANCPTGTTAVGDEDCDLILGVQGAGSMTEIFKLDTDTDGNTTVQMGAPGSNYVDVTEAGVMTAQGSATITATDLAADGVDALTEIDQAVKMAANDTDKLAVFNGAAPGSTQCVQINTSGQMSATGAACGSAGSEVRSMYWPAGSMSSDGTNCADPAEATPVASAFKTYVVVCADGGTFYGQAVLPDGLDDTADVSFELTATDGTGSVTLAGDFSYQCWSNDEAITSSWQTGAACDVTLTTADDLYQTTTTGIDIETPCAAGDFFAWRYVIDDANHDATSAEILGVKMEYTTSVGD